jgi:hypothetical protein
MVMVIVMMKVIEARRRLELSAKGGKAVPG